MFDKITENTQINTFDKLNNLLYLPSPSLSEIEEFCSEIATETKQSKKKVELEVLNTTLLFYYYYSLIFSKGKVSLEQFKKNSKEFANLADLIRNKWGFLSQNVRNLTSEFVEENIPRYLAIFEKIYEIIELNKKTEKFMLIPSFRSNINQLEKFLDEVKQSMTNFKLAVDEVSSKPLSETRIWEQSTLAEKSQKNIELSDKIKQIKSESDKKKVHLVILEQLFEYIEELSPNNEQIKQLRRKILKQNFEESTASQIPSKAKEKESVISNHIEITPGVCGGKPRIAGHRIRVQDVVIWHEKMGLSPDEIVFHHPSINLADVYAALAYYHDNREEIRRQIKESEDFVRELQAKNPSKLQQKLKGRNVTND